MVMAGSFTLVPAVASGLETHGIALLITITTMSHSSARAITCHAMELRPHGLHVAANYLLLQFVPLDDAAYGKKNYRLLCGNA
jgi:hypothetical protein